MVLVCSSRVRSLGLLVPPVLARAVEGARQGGRGQQEPARRLPRGGGHARLDQRPPYAGARL